ncbi:MAG: hypothetical protein KIH63_002155 [Candidatus Saccharibacteria bacterium]|nr:hypothetical protein [Candidatus Saccharibacteria bacterium]
MASGESAPNPDFDGLKLAGKFATLALTVLTAQRGVHIDRLSDVVVVTGMTIADGGLGYLSFRDGLTGRFVGRRLNKGQSVSMNRPINARLAGIAMAFGGILSGSIALDQYMGDKPVTTTAPPASVLTLPPKPAEVTVITNPVITFNSEPPTSPEYPCELEPFSPDGDGFPSTGSGSQITKLQNGINVLAPRLNIEQIEVTGDLVDNTESIQAITVFKDWAAAQLGDSFVPGPEGQVTLQMCSLLDLWNDGNSNTP